MPPLNTDGGWMVPCAMPKSKPLQGSSMEDRALTAKGLYDFEQIHLERLRLAAQVILEAAPDLALVTDPLEVELTIFKERVEFLLLLPDDADQVPPWRRLLNGEEHPSRMVEAKDGGEQP
jgi:hypothetical protein